MRAIVIPVKAFSQAKSRLARHLSGKERAALAAAFCRDLFDAVAQVRGVDRVFVVTNEPHAASWARRNGWEVLVETQQQSEAASIDFACRHCEDAGISALLRLPADIPLLVSADVEEIFAALGESRAAVMVPSRDGTGTNALLRAPPTAFPSFFGKDSWTRHLLAARAADVAVRIVNNPRIALDIDTPEDLEILRGRVATDSHSGQWFGAFSAEVVAGSAQKMRTSK